MNSFDGGLARGLITREELNLRQAADRRARDAAERQAKYQEHAMGLQDSADSRASTAASNQNDEFEFNKTLRPQKTKDIELGLSAKEQALASSKAAAARADKQETRTDEAYEFGKNTVRPMKMQEMQLGLDRQKQLQEQNAAKIARDQASMKYARQADFLESVADDGMTWDAVNEEFADVVKSGKFTNIAANSDGTISFFSPGPDGKPVEKKTTKAELVGGTVESVDPATGAKVAKQVLGKAEQLRRRAAIMLNPVAAMRPTSRSGKTAEQIDSAAKQKQLSELIKGLERQVVALDTKLATKKPPKDAAAIKARRDGLQDELDKYRMKQAESSGVPYETQADRDSRAAQEELGRARTPVKKHFWSSKEVDQKAAGEAEKKAVEAARRVKQVRGLDVTDKPSTAETDTADGGMTEQDFIDDFNNEYGRDPTAVELQNALNKGYISK